MQLHALATSGVKAEETAESSDARGFVLSHRISRHIVCSREGGNRFEYDIGNVQEVDENANMVDETEEDEDEEEVDTDVLSSDETSEVQDSDNDSFEGSLRVASPRIYESGFDWTTLQAWDSAQRPSVVSIHLHRWLLTPIRPLSHCHIYCLNPPLLLLHLKPRVLAEELLGPLLALHSLPPLRLP